MRRSATPLATFYPATFYPNFLSKLSIEKGSIQTFYPNFLSRNVLSKLSIYNLFWFMTKISIDTFFKLHKTYYRYQVLYVMYCITPRVMEKLFYNRRRARTPNLEVFNKYLPSRESLCRRNRRYRNTMACVNMKPER